MRRDDQVRHFPQWRRCRQGLGIENIENRAREFATLQSLAQFAVVDDAGAADIDKAGAGFHRSDGSRIDQVSRAGGERCRHENEVRLCEPFVQLLDRQHGVCVTVWRGLPAHTCSTPHAEMLGRLGRGASHVAQSHHQQSLAGDGRREDLLPLCPMLVVDHFRQPVAEREQRHSGEFAGLSHMHAAVVGQGHIVGQPVERQQGLDASADDVDPTELWRRGGKCCLGKRRIDDQVIACHQPFSRREPAHVAQILAHRPAHAASPSFARLWAACTSSDVM